MVSYHGSVWVVRTLLCKFLLPSSRIPQQRCTGLPFDVSRERAISNMAFLLFQRRCRLKIITYIVSDQQSPEASLGKGVVRFGSANVRMSWKRIMVVDRKLGYIFGWKVKRKCVHNELLLVRRRFILCSCDDPWFFFSQSILQWYKRGRVLQRCRSHCLELVCTVEREQHSTLKQRRT